MLIIPKAWHVLFKESIGQTLVRSYACVNKDYKCKYIEEQLNLVLRFGK